MQTNIKMHKGSQHKNTSFDFIKSIKQLGIDLLAERTGFRRRTPKKITSTLLLQSFYGTMHTGRFSLSNWAVELSFLIGTRVSKQAIFYRITPPFIDLTRELLLATLQKQITPKGWCVTSRFKRILLQDSSCIKLPDHLKHIYPGNYSGGTIKAVAKLQVIYDILATRFETITLSPYNRNDQAAAGDIIPLLQQGDLVIRDLGYFVLAVFEKIKCCGASFISRYRNEVALLDYKTKHRINLLKLIRGKTFIKKKVLIGANQQICVTLYAVKLDRRQAACRRKMAINDRDKRKVMTAEKLLLLGWDVFISNEEDLTADEIALYYKMRWNIELIFKTWKSHFNLEKLIPAKLKNSFLADAIIYQIMLFVVLVMMPIYQLLCLSMGRNKWKISILKLSKIILDWVYNMNWRCSSVDFLAPFVFYETRSRRPMTKMYF